LPEGKRRPPKREGRIRGGTELFKRTGAGLPGLPADGQKAEAKLQGAFHRGKKSHIGMPLKNGCTFFFLGRLLADRRALRKGKGRFVGKEADLVLCNKPGP